MIILPRVVLAQMTDVSPAWRERMRELSFGAYSGTMWRWTFHKAACWVAVGFKCQPRPSGYEPSDMVGWACWTENEEPHPVMGVYVDKEHRKAGYASQLAQSLIDSMKHRQRQGGIVYAVASYWPAWATLIEKAGFTFNEWE